MKFAKCAIFPLFFCLVLLSNACGGGGGGGESKESAPTVPEAPPVIGVPDKEQEKPKNFVDPGFPINATTRDSYEPDDTQPGILATKDNDRDMSVGGVQQRNFFDNHVDWIRFNAKKDSTYEIETVVYGYADTVLEIYDQDKLLAWHDDKIKDKDYGSRIEWKAPESKNYTVRIRSYGSMTGEKRPYRLSLKDMAASPGGLSLPMAPKPWTVMVYLDGDNNLASFSAKDMEEMKTVGGVGTNNFNIVVLWDNGEDRHGYYYVTKGNAELLRDTGQINMGNPQTAKDFIDFTHANFPAEKVMFIFWDHGGGVDRLRAEPTYKGVCWDDNSGDHLSESDQLDIISHAAQYQGGKKVDIVGYDACLMATAEVFYQMKDVASYAVASEQLEPGDGWNFTFLNTLVKDPHTAPDVLAKAVCVYYSQFFSTNTDVTLSAVDLAYMDDLGGALSDFATTAMKSGASGAVFNALADKLPLFGDEYTRDLVAYMDAIAASDKVSQEVKAKAVAVRALVAEKVVIHEWHSPAWDGKAYGCSITCKADTPIYSNLLLCRDTTWDEFCEFSDFPQD